MTYPATQTYVRPTDKGPLAEARRALKMAEGDARRAERALRRRIGGIEPELSTLAARDDHEGGPLFVALSYENAETRRRVWARVVKLMEAMS